MDNDKLIEATKTYISELMAAGIETTKIDTLYKAFMEGYRQAVDEKEKMEEEPQPKRWRDDENATVCGFSITMDSQIIQADGRNNCYNRNTFATEKLVKSALAMARISQIMVNDPRFGGAVTDKEWEDDLTSKWIIQRNGGTIVPNTWCSHYHFLAFHTKEQRDLFLRENEDLVKDYLMID
jgi:hypothetical protein